MHLQNVITRSLPLLFPLCVNAWITYQGSQTQRELEPIFLESKRAVLDLQDNVIFRNPPDTPLYQRCIEVAEKVDIAIQTLKVFQEGMDRENREEFSREHKKVGELKRVSESWKIRAEGTLNKTFMKRRLRTSAMEKYRMNTAARRADIMNRKAALDSLKVEKGNEEAYAVEHLRKIERMHFADKKKLEKADFVHLGRELDAVDRLKDQNQMDIEREQKQIDKDENEWNDYNKERAAFMESRAKKLSHMVHEELVRPAEDAYAQQVKHMNVLKSRHRKSMKDVLLLRKYLVGVKFELKTSITGYNQYHLSKAI